MTAAAPRDYTKLGVAIVIAAVVIGAGIFASTYFETAARSPPAVATTTTTTPSCSPTNDLAAPRHFAFNIAVNYTGPWEATVAGYSSNGAPAAASTAAFVDCYTGNGVGLIYLTDWNEGGLATLRAVAGKSGPGNGSLSISVTFGSSNSTTRTNSTSLPYGTATVTATMLGEAAIIPSSTVTASASAVQLYDVTFRQSGACSPLAYVAPWSVTLGNETIAEPSNATLPVQNGTYTAGPEYQNLSTIVFSVPNGVYQYKLAPFGAFGPNSGSVTVDGSDVTVVANGPILSCAPTAKAPG